MKIREIINNTGLRFSRADVADFCVKGVTGNSKEVKKDYIFVAIKGNRADGNKFIQEAIDKGASAVITSETRSRASKERVSFLKAENTRQALAKLAAEFYGNPSRKVRVAGVTGTNGKTTVTYLIEAILKEGHFNPAVIGTVNYRFNDKSVLSKNTTPGPVELQAMLARMASSDVDYCIMEVSSHALDQDRVCGIDFACAIFTNLTQDHLDYHKNLEGYFRAKARLFYGLDRKAFAVINSDDKYGRRLFNLTNARVISYGIDNKAADIRAKGIKFNARFTEFTLTACGKEICLKTPLIGRHNVYNILAAWAWASGEGISTPVLKSVISKFSFVPGRLERVGINADFSVFVDYAHTDDALKNILVSLRQVSKKRIIVVFGCGGERDKTKRPKMGRVATRLSDYAIITNDNPRSEDPRKIIRDITAGIVKNNYCIIPDRFTAIKKSISLAKSGDIVLVAGKGHENYQILADRTVKFNDREAVRRCLR